MGNAGRTGPSTPATAALEALGIPWVPRPFAAGHDSTGDGYGLEAARALGVDAERVFKTIVVTADGALAAGVVPVAGRLDLRAVAAALGAKRAALADRALAERRTGSVAGGISPVGQGAMPVLLDESALAHGTILVSGGRRGFDIELAPGDLLHATAGRTALIAR